LSHNSFAVPRCADRLGLIKHALAALRECLPSEIRLNSSNTTVAVVGKDEPLSLNDDEAVRTRIRRVACAPHGA
jgi:20S proteasome subunit alpha 6